MITSLRSANTGNFATKTKDSSASVAHYAHTKTSQVSNSAYMQNKKSVTTTQTNTNDGATSDNSDDDILHVVTNVYTIPIMKSTSAGNGPFVTDSKHDLNVTTSCDEAFLKNEHTQKTTKNSLTSSNSVPVAIGEPICYKKTVYSTDQQPSHLAEQVSQNNKSKFQIRSIVEIYENPIEEQEQDKCTLKNSGHFEETTTKEVITDFPGNSSPSPQSDIYITNSSYLFFVICFIECWRLGCCTFIYLHSHW